MQICDLHRAIYDPGDPLRSHFPRQGERENTPRQQSMAINPRSSLCPQESCHRRAELRATPGPPDAFCINKMLCGFIYCPQIWFAGFVLRGGGHPFAEVPRPACFEEKRTKQGRARRRGGPVMGKTARIAGMRTPNRRTRGSAADTHCHWHSIARHRAVRGRQFCQRHPKCTFNAKATSH